MPCFGSYQWWAERGHHMLLLVLNYAKTGLAHQPKINILIVRQQRHETGSQSLYSIKVQSTLTWFDSSNIFLLGVGGDSSLGQQTPPKDNPQGWVKEIKPTAIGMGKLHQHLF